MAKLGVDRRPWTAYLSTESHSEKHMSLSVKDQVVAALKTLAIPGADRDIVAAGLVSDIYVDGGRVIFSITVPADSARELEGLRKLAEIKVSKIDGVDKAIVTLTSEVAPGAPHQTAGADKPRGMPPKAGIPGVDKIIAVASAKGGVGKSTTAVNLALGLAATGLKVGILDADIYGPSVPRLMGIDGQPEMIDRTFVPMENYGLKVMSIGFLVDEDTPMIWRGPMVVSALTQMLRESAWGELDVLVVDMPPGTGDIQLSMAQQVPLAGAIIVSTPQDLALLDARRGIAMFGKVEIPVLGLVENMSYFLCPHCGGRSDVFGHGGARHEAERMGVPFLGEVPLELAIRETSDAGRPVVATAPDGPHAKVYIDMAKALRATLESGAGQHQGPRIVIE